MQTFIKTHDQQHLIFADKLLDMYNITKYSTLVL